MCYARTTHTQPHRSNNGIEYIMHVCFCTQIAKDKSLDPDIRALYVVIFCDRVGIGVWNIGFIISLENTQCAKRSTQM